MHRTIQLPDSFKGNEDDIRAYVAGVISRPIGVTLDGLIVTLHNDVTPEEAALFSYAGLQAQVQARWDDEAAQGAERADVRAAYTKLNDYIALSSPTSAQTVAVVKLLCRVAIILGKRALGVK